jgi:hypothetical protein
LALALACGSNDTLSNSVADTFNARLTVRLAGNGTGKVTTKAIGNNATDYAVFNFTCPNSCSGVSDLDVHGPVKVELTAAPDAGSTFAGWSGACASALTALVDTLTLDVEKDWVCTATFTKPVPPGKHFYVVDGGINGRIAQFDDLTGTGWTTSTTFPGARGIFVDAAHEIFVADAANNRIARMTDIADPSPVMFGTAGSGDGNFMSPTSVFVDAAGKIYVADGTNNRIVRMDNMNGDGWAWLGTMGTGDKEFTQPSSVFVDGGKIYVVDLSNDRIVRMDDMAGTNWVPLGAYGTGDKQFISPRAVVVDAGKIYVADEGNKRVVRMDDMAGAGWTVLSASSPPGSIFTGPRGIAFDAAGMYVADYTSAHVVHVDDMTGSHWTTFGTSGNGTNQFAVVLAIFVR